MKTLIICLCILSIGLIGEQETTPQAQIKPNKPLYYNGQVLLPGYVLVDTVVVINANLLNELIPLSGTDEDISEALGEGTIAIQDYSDYVNTVSK